MGQERTSPDGANAGFAPRPGDVLAQKYRVEKTLGQGGMGVVVLAMHLALDQRVALKFLQPALAGDPDMAARFLREARNAVRLTSEHVARVFDVGTLENGAPYMVMEYLEGQDLGQVLDEGGPLTISAAVDATLQAIDAIAEAHDLGIVHRDLKPQNLFLTRRGGRTAFVKVLDFGISKAIDTNEQRPLTKTRAILGSPAYMAPEQMRSARTVDGRADIWALGVLLYELLTARVPFYSDSLPEQCLMVTQDPLPPICEKRPDLPAGLSKVIERCLEKEPSARFANVRELAAALEPYRKGADAPPVVTHPAGSRFHTAPKLLRLKLDSTQPAALETVEAAPVTLPDFTAPLPPSAASWTGSGIERSDAPIASPRAAHTRAIALGIAGVAVTLGIIFAIAGGRREHPATLPSNELPPAALAPAETATAAPHATMQPEPATQPALEPAETTAADGGAAEAVKAVAPLAKPKLAAPRRAVADGGVKPASEHRTAW